MKYVLTLLCFALFLSCTKSSHPTNEITKVELARSGAWSDYGAAISINSSLNYSYCNNNVKHGYFTGKVSEGFWDTLNRKFEKIKYKSLPVTDNKLIQDGNYFELIIHWKNGKKRITRVRDIKSDSVLDVLLWLNDSYKTAKLHQVNYPIKFETTYQNPPPKPIIDQLYFPPPIKQ
ncbi:MAG TPA: hypothetical protein DCO83_13325 [Mucilaginibacter sp.]|jgi:hypothetical protein|nr:hypothetical protein [Mucilaginibacter sp.]